MQSEATTIDVTTDELPLDADQRIWSFVLPIVQAHGLELVDARLHRDSRSSTLLVIVDRVRPDGSMLGPGGVTIDECAQVSRDLGTALDVHDDMIEGSYRLEVSSPGVDRPLVRPHDFVRFAGNEVRVTTKMPIEGRRNFTGRLVGLVGLAADGSRRGVDLDEGTTRIRLPLADIAKANIVHRWESKQGLSKLGQKPRKQGR